jgi:hypothetical protein
VAELECGHTQHLRHTPPWQVRLWVLTSEGRASRIGTRLPCRKCSDAQAGVAESMGTPERVRSALVQIALAAYEDAALRGLCCEGAWEAAIAAMRQVDLSSSPRPQS